MIKLGQIPTPIEYANTLLDLANYKSNIVGKKVLENSCGDGNVLVEIVRRYILDARNKKWSNEKIRKGMLRDIIGYEVDCDAINSAILRLDSLCHELNIKPISWNIKCMDYLKQDADVYDYIIGNPPYITYHDLNPEQRTYLKEKFQSCKNGRFDYSYAFIEKSINEISTQGTLSYLIPFSIFRNKYAEELRNMLLPKLDSIVNYSGIDVFPNHTIGAAIIVCKHNPPNKISYKRPSGDINKIIEKKCFQNKWIFEGNDISVGHQRFGDFFDVFNSVATLRNSVYILKESYKEGHFTIVNDYKIENKLILDAVSPRSLKYKHKYKIIFPYYIYKDKIRVIPEDVFKSKFPCCFEYFVTNKEELSNRKVSPYTCWYEYGRSQALTSVLKEKLIMPMIISGKVVTYYSGKKEVPYAGYCIVSKTNRLSLKEAARIIESSDFFEYVKSVGTPTTKNSYRLSVSDILGYPL